MEFSFFITDNKSGYKTNLKWLEKNHPDELNLILNYCQNKLPDNSTLKEKIWFYFHKLSARPKCLSCGKEIKFSGRFDRGYNNFCSINCINQNKELMVDMVKKSMQKKYGVNFYPQHTNFIEKQRLTKKQKYGNENYNNVEKIKETKKIKYGFENYNNKEKYRETSLKKYGFDNFTKTKEYKKKIDLIYKNLYPNLNIQTINNKNVTIKCHSCDNLYTINKQLIYERNKLNQNVCTICNPIGQSFISHAQNEIAEFIKSLEVDVIQSHKILKNGREIDIFLPSFNIGIEYNGLYWHNELFVDRDYHLNKTLECNDLGVDLIHIFEDEWIFKKDILKSIIRNKLKKIENKIFARNCIIKEINSKECNKFLETNHIQDKVNAKIKLGLYHNDILVSVMTFNRGRILMGGKKEEWELTRFCNLLNFNVVGASSKLLHFFKKKYNPKKIVSYSDIRLFNGNLYKTLNFEEKHRSNPNYWYVLNEFRKHRFSFRKSILVKEGFDLNKTEHQIMLDRKIYRIYDCGNVRWELNL